MEYPEPKSLTELNRLIGLFAYYCKWIPNCSNLTQRLTNSREHVATQGHLNESGRQALQELKEKLKEATLAVPDFSLPVTIETDASGTALGGTLNQNGLPFAFFSRSLTNSERKQSIIKREARAIVDSIRRWRDIVKAVL